MYSKDEKGIRLNFYMKPSLVAKIDEYAKSIGITRSGAISVLCSNQLQSLDSSQAIAQLARFTDSAEAMDKIISMYKSSESYKSH